MFQRRAPVKEPQEGIATLIAPGSAIVPGPDTYLPVRCPGRCCRTGSDPGGSLTAVSLNQAARSRYHVWACSIGPASPLHAGTFGPKGSRAGTIAVGLPPKLVAGIAQARRQPFNMSITFASPT